nr:alpha-glycosidase [Lachnospiraceae bacterium]
KGDQYDSIMNYSFTKACLDYFSKKTLTTQEMSDRLNDILARNNNVVNDLMLNLLDSHDTPRFITEVSGDKELFMNALCLLYLFPGTPCIFYGTEIMTEGGGDPDCRRCMDWKKAEKAGNSETVRLIRKLADLRGNYNLLTKDVKICAKEGMLTISYKNRRTDLELRINNEGKRSLRVNDKELL